MEDVRLSKLTQVFKKNKKKVIAISIVIILLVAGIVGMQVYSSTKKVKKIPLETKTLETHTLTNSISATGTIEAKDSQKEQTALSGYEITAVNIKVGDRVKAGDILCTLDVSSIKDSADTVQKSIETGEKQNNITEESAKRSLDYAKETQDASNEQINSKISNAEDNLNEIKDNQNDLENNLEKAKKKTKDTQKNYSSKKKEYESLKQEYDTKNSAYETAKVASDAAMALVDKLNAQIAATSDLEQLKQLNETLAAAKQDLSDKLNITSIAKEELTAVQATYAEAQKAYESSKGAYETAKTNEASVSAQLDSTKTAVDTAQESYDSIINERDNSNRTNENTVKTQEANLATTRLTNETSLDSKKNELKKYEDQLEKGNVTARMDGVVTAVNVSVGDIYTGTNMFVIEDDSSYIVEATIDEYDIGSLTLGMPVVIKTNATGEEELQGTITFLSPKPETSTTTTATDVVYKMEVSVDSQNDKLRLGMTAKLSIILESKENVLALPYDAVTQTQDGQGTILVVEAQGEEPKEIPVTLGLETDYYIEVSGDNITQGMQVVIPSSNIDASQIPKMGPMGGF